MSRHQNHVATPLSPNIVATPLQLSFVTTPKVCHDTNFSSLADSVSRRQRPCGDTPNNCPYRDIKSCRDLELACCSPTMLRHKTNVTTWGQGKHVVRAVPMSWAHACCRARQRAHACRPCRDTTCCVTTQGWKWEVAPSSGPLKPPPPLFFLLRILQ